MKLISRSMAVFATTALIFVVAPSPAHAAETGETGHDCIVKVERIDSEGMFKLSKPRCFDTYAEVLESQGVPSARAKGLTPATTSSATVLAAGIIGTHYDGYSGSGASFSVTGAACNGGGLNVSTAWNDRISSTLNGCPTIIHYETYNYAGSSFTSYTGGTITNMNANLNNKTTSILYF